MATSSAPSSQLSSRTSSSHSLFPLSSPTKPKLVREGSETPPISASRRSSLEKKVEEAKQVIRDAIDLYGLDHLSISFNGGKDCTLLLHLFHSLLPPSSSSTTSSPLAPSSSSPSTPPKIKALYITAPHPFQEVEDFVDQAVTDYNLDLVRLGGGMKAALGEYLDETGEVEPSGKGKGRGVKGMLVGTRRNDPHGASLSLSQPTDPSWPSLMRIHPILNWSYTDVWDYLREYHIPWCSLYDEGYTSLGSLKNTHPNPALLLRPRTGAGSGGPEEGEKGGGGGSGPAAMYQPAWMLVEEGLERAGRGDPVK